jgi:DNA helicase-2/ATP-dependent DNA helicase PcrA
VLPSRFIDELPPANVDAVSETGYTMQAGGVREAASRLDSYAPGAGFNSAYQSPGWRRAQENKNQRTGRPPMIEGEARLVAKSGEGDSHYGVGDRIFHQKFGYGRVRTVAFEKAGEKRVIDSFVIPASAA